MQTDSEILDDITNREYEFGFVTQIETEYAPKGLNTDTVRFISAKKEEPQWLLDWRLKALTDFENKDKNPDWQNFPYSC